MPASRSAIGASERDRQRPAGPEGEPDREPDGRVAEREGDPGEGEDAEGEHEGGEAEPEQDAVERRPRAASASPGASAREAGGGSGAGSSTAAQLGDRGEPRRPPPRPGRRRAPPAPRAARRAPTSSPKVNTPPARAPSVNVTQAESVVALPPRVARPARSSRSSRSRTATRCRRRRRAAAASDQDELEPAHSPTTAPTRDLGLEVHDAEDLAPAVAVALERRVAVDPLRRVVAQQSTSLRTVPPQQRYQPPSTWGSKS